MRWYLSMNRILRKMHHYFCSSCIHHFPPIHMRLHSTHIHFINWLGHHRCAIVAKLDFVACACACNCTLAYIEKSVGLTIRITGWQYARRIVAVTITKATTAISNEYGMVYICMEEGKKCLFITETNVRMLFIVRLSNKAPYRYVCTKSINTMDHEPCLLNLKAIKSTRKRTVMATEKYETQAKAKRTSSRKPGNGWEDEQRQSREKMNLFSYPIVNQSQLKCYTLAN